jgi:hypothetical protein
MNTNGIGLGLVIIDNIVNKFGGKIGFYSKEFEGSEFFFTFKLESELTEPSKGLKVKQELLEFRWKPLKKVSCPRVLKYVNTFNEIPTIQEIKHPFNVSSMIEDDYIHQISSLPNLIQNEDSV